MKTAILFLLLFVAATTSGLANPMIMINGPAAPLPVGNLFVVTMDIVRVTDLYAWPFDLNYELPAPQSPYPQVADLRVLSITEGSFLQNAGQTCFAAGTDDPVAGSISFSVETPQDAILRSIRRWNPAGCVLPGCRLAVNQYRANRCGCSFPCPERNEAPSTRRAIRHAQTCWSVQDPLWARPLANCRE